MLNKDFKRILTKKVYLIISSIIVVSIYLISPLKSQPFIDLLPNLLANDESINSSRVLIDKANNDLSSAISGYTPKLSITVPYGYEHQINNNTKNSHLVFSEYNMKITQNILDFGVTSSSINKAKTGIELAGITKNNIASNKIYEALDAYLNYMKSYKVFNFSKQSEERIMEVSNLENAKVQRGGGLATNVLQSKAQLAGARASRVQSEGALAISKNRFYSIFRRLPENFQTFTKPRLPAELLPISIDEAIKIAMKNNMSLNMSDLALKNANLSIKSAKAKFFPSLQASAEYKNKRDSSGVIGTEIDQIYKLELSYPISIGGPGVLFYKEKSDYKSAINSYASSKYTHDQMKRTIEESVRNAWQIKETSKSNAQYLRNQANISGEFFDLAMKEVQLGNRQLIDVLSSETSYINAISSSESAQNDYELSVYQLLLSIGILNEALFYNTEDKININKEINKEKEQGKNKKVVSKITYNPEEARVGKPFTSIELLKEEIPKEGLVKKIKKAIKKINNNKEVIKIIPKKVVAGGPQEGRDNKNLSFKPKNLIITKDKARNDLRKSNIVPNKKNNNENNIDISKNFNKEKEESISLNLVDLNKKNQKTKEKTTAIKIEKNVSKNILLDFNKFKVQLGAFSSVKNAEKQLTIISNKIKEHKKDLGNIEIVSINELFKIQNVIFLDKNLANNICNDIKIIGFNCILVQI